MSLSFLLRLAALIVFCLALAGVSFGVSMLLLGLALWVASTLVDTPPAFVRQNP